MDIKKETKYCNNVAKLMVCVCVCVCACVCVCVCDFSPTWSWQLGFARPGPTVPALPTLPAASQDFSPKCVA
jgi:hypothetical protein